MTGIFVSMTEMGQTNGVAGLRAPGKELCSRMTGISSFTILQIEQNGQVTHRVVGGGWHFKMIETFVFMTIRILASGVLGHIMANFVALKFEFLYGKDCYVNSMLIFRNCLK